MALFGVGFVAKKVAAKIAGPILHEIAEAVGVPQDDREVMKKALNIGASITIAAACADPLSLLD